MAKKVKVYCPTCQAHLQVEEANLGKKGRCPQCRSIFELTIPICSAQDFSDPQKVPLEWHKGDTILGLYEVRQIHDGGGMGLVYRVKHRGWNLDLAVKSPRAEFFQVQAQKDNFVRECQTWIDLGLHSHIVSCYYVRTLGGVPRVFAEYVEGGSLKDWIESRRLYEGDRESALARILDIAIQFAWGLAYAHEKGLVHQDIKPGNVLLTSDGTAKVTDFGLARARATTAETQITGKKDRSLLVSSGGMTPAYCSPEQANRQPLSSKTDIWSWAISVLEMFYGQPPCPYGGQAAEDVFQAYREYPEENTDVPSMPDPLARVIQDCYQHDPEKRPASMDDISKTLCDIYRNITRREYPRQKTMPTDLLADGLNNRAVSMFDLGQQKQAEVFLDQAAQFDPRHLEVGYNRGLLLWRSGRMTDDALVKGLEDINKDAFDKSRGDLLLANIHMERGDAESARNVLVSTKRNENMPNVAAALQIIEEGLKTWTRNLKIIEGHKDGIRSLDISSDGRWVLSCDTNKTIYLWDLTAGQVIREFQAGSPVINCVVFAPDGKIGISSSYGFLGKNHIQLWDLNTGQCQGTFPDQNREVPCTIFCPGGRYVLLGGTDGKIQLWDTADNQCLRVMMDPIQPYPIKTICLSPDGRRILSGSNDNDVKLWDLDTGECLIRLKGHTGLGVNSVAMSPDGRWAVSGGYDQTIRLWDLQVGKCIRILKGHDSCVSSVCISPDSRNIVSGSYDGTIRLWNVSSGRCMRTFTGHTDMVTCVKICENGKWALSGSMDKTMRIWKLFTPGPQADFVISRPKSTMQLVETADSVRKTMNEVRLAMNQDRPGEALSKMTSIRALAGYERNPDLLHLWRMVGTRCRRTGLENAWLVHELRGHTHRVDASIITHDDRRIISSSLDYSIRVWDIETGQHIKTLATGDSSSIESLSLSRDGRWLLLGNTFLPKLVDLTNEARRDIIDRNKIVDWGNIACISPDGRWCLSGGPVGQYIIQLWNLATGRKWRQFEGHTAGVTAICWNMDGRWALSASQDKTVRLWEAATGKCVRLFEGHTDYVRAVDFTPNGRYAVSASDDKTLRLWDIFTGQCRQTFTGHQDYVSSICISSDGRWAASGGTDKTIRLWDLSDGRCLKTLQGHLGIITSLNMSSDCRWLVSSSADSTLRVWELDWNYEFPGWADWDEAAKPWFEAFLNCHRLCPTFFPRDQAPSDEDVIKALTPTGRAVWNKSDYEDLLRTLENAGFGWIHSKSVAAKLEEMAATLHGSSSPPESF